MRSSTQPNTIGPTNPIARDIQNVVTDAQELLKTVQAEGESKLADVKSKMQTQFDSAKDKMQAQLDAAKQTFGELQTTVQDGAKVAVNSTDAYVRSNPWRAVGISAALGALIGFLVARR